MVKRPYLIVGSVGLLAMTPLAATSTNYMIKRMGPKRWQALHRLAYVAAIAGVVHFYMLVKSDIRLPVAYGSVVGILLGYRAVGFSAAAVEKSGCSGQRDLGGIARRRSLEGAASRRADRAGNARTLRHFAWFRPSKRASRSPICLDNILTFSLQIGGKPVARSYTIASTPSRPGYCEVTIKREEQGLVSRHMHDTVQEGDILTIAAPGGKFTFTGAEANRVVLLAAGVGITPLMSILRYLTDQNWSGQIYMVYCCKTAKDIIFREELESIERRFPNLHLTLTLTRAEGTNWNGAVGRIDAKLLTSVVPDLTDFRSTCAARRKCLRRPAISCGSWASPSITSARSRSACNDRRRASEGAAPTGGEEFTVTFSRSNKTAKIDGSRPILTLAEELGRRSGLRVPRGHLRNLQVPDAIRIGADGDSRTR